MEEHYSSFILTIKEWCGDQNVVFSGTYLTKNHDFALV